MENSLANVSNTELIAELNRRTAAAHAIEQRLKSEYVEPPRRKLFFTICALIALVMFVCYMFLPKELSENPIFLLVFGVTFAISMFGNDMQRNYKNKVVRKKFAAEYADDYALLYDR